MPISLKASPGDGKQVPDTIAEVSHEFMLKLYPPADPKLSPCATAQGGDHARLQADRQEKRSLRG